MRTSSCLMPFKVNQMVDNGEEDKLIKEHDEDKCRVCEEACPSVIYMRLLWIFINLAQLTFNYLVLVVQEEVEGNSESC